MANRTVLLIDYEPRSIEDTKRPLVEAGYHVEVAHDGVTGLEAFHRLHPDLVVVEAMLPKKHGFDVCQEIKKSDDGRGTPVVITTGVYRGRKYRNQALKNFGCDEYLEKPFSQEALLDACNRFIREDIARAVDPSGDGDREASTSEAGPVEATPRHSGSSDLESMTEDEISSRLDSLLADFGKAVDGSRPPDDRAETASVEPIDGTTPTASGRGEDPVEAGTTERAAREDSPVKTPEATSSTRPGPGAPGAGEAPGPKVGPDVRATVAAERKGDPAIAAEAKTSVMSATSRATPAVPAPPKRRGGRIALAVATVVAIAAAAAVGWWMFDRSRNAVDRPVVSDAGTGSGRPASATSSAWSAGPPPALPAGDPATEVAADPLATDNEIPTLEVQDPSVAAAESERATAPSARDATPSVRRSSDRTVEPASEPAAASPDPTSRRTSPPTPPPASPSPPTRSEPARSTSPPETTTTETKAGTPPVARSVAAPARPDVEPSSDDPGPARTVPVAGEPPVGRDAAEARPVPSPAAERDAAPAARQPARDVPEPVETPAPAVRAGDLVPLAECDVAPVAIEHPAPVYHPFARKLRQQGTVVVEVLVDETGRVDDVRVVRDIPKSVLNDQVVNAVRRWRYSPATKDGVPVKVWKTESFLFRP